MIEQPPAPSDTPPAPPGEISARIQLDRWTYGRILLTISGALALLAFYAPWERATYFDSGAPGNQQVRDLAFATIFTSILRPGASFYGIYMGGSFVDNVTRDLVNTIPAMLGLLFAMALWLQIGRRLSFAVLAASAVIFLGAVVVAVEYLRLILAVQSGDAHAMGDATRIGSLPILKGPLYAYRTTTFTWGYYLLLATLLLWAVGLALVIMALRRATRTTPEAQSAVADARLRRRRDRATVAALLGVGVAAFTAGVNYLPWLTFTCPKGFVNSIHFSCVSGTVTGNAVYTVVAHLPAQSQSYQQIVSARLISPSILNVGNDVIFGSLVPFTFIALVGLGAALCALLLRARRVWGYWAYFAFVALVMAVIFARTKTVFDENKIGKDSLGVGALVTVVGALLIGVGGGLLQRRGTAPRARIPAN